jgi:DNA-directed RNA polymerase specialized sigma24 family protein
MSQIIDTVGATLRPLEERRPIDLLSTRCHLDVEVYQKFRDQLIRLIVTQTRSRFWPSTKHEEAADETIAELVSQGLAPMIPAFVRQEVSDPGYALFRAALYPALRRVIDRARERHKKEIKPGSFDYDPNYRGSRQRRELAEELLCGRDVVAESEPGPADWARSADVNSALERLSELERAIVKARVFDQKAWDDIGGFMNLSAATVKKRYHQAFAKLSVALKSYHEV